MVSPEYELIENEEKRKAIFEDKKTAFIQEINTKMDAQTIKFVFYNSKKEITELNKRTEFDDSCALHLHIGNIPRTPEFILAFYKVMSFFEDEMYEMFPLYKKYNFEIKTPE